MGFLLLVVVLVLRGPVDAGAEALAGEGPSPGSAALRSLMLPGWGQAANHRWIKGGLFFTAYSGFILWGVSINQDVQDAKGQRNAADNPADEASWQSEVDRLENSRDAKIWLAGLTLLLSVADAFVDAHLRGFDERIDADVGFMPTDSDPVLGFRVTARFDTPGGRTR